MDEAFAPLQSLFDALAVSAEPLIDLTSINELDESWRQGIYIEQMSIELPIEIEIAVEDTGSVRLAGSPPTQYTETSIMPIFHQLKLYIVAQKANG